MRHRLFIAGGPEAMEMFRWSQERLAAAWRETADHASLIGSIHVGKVSTIDAALKCAFVDLGKGQPGMLPLKKSGANPTEGETILVQVRRDGWAGKGPRLTRDIKSEESIAGLAPSGPPRLIVPAPPAWARFLAELDPGEVGEIHCDRRIDATGVQQWCSRHAPELAARVAHKPAREWSRTREEALEALEEALEETVTLPGGGMLLIEPVRTLTAIDVNSASAGMSAFEVDLAAAAEIPRQLSLRNLGGVIVVDFIDIDDRGRRERVVEALREAAGIDPGIEWIGNMSRLGLVEIQRRRRGPSLGEMWRGIAPAGGR